MSSPKNKSFAFLPEKSFISETDRSQRYVKKELQKNFRTSPLVLIPDPSSPNPSTPSAVETPDNKEEDSDDPEPADIYISKWNTPLISCTAQI